ncbi:MAG: hypothetical protein RL518_2146 [Pseudomonadota bacterium]
MNPSFSSREQEVRQLGKKLEVEIAEGKGSFSRVFEDVLRLPASDLPMLQDTMLSLCDARLGGRDGERIVRLENFGATTIRYLGLFFDRQTINEEFVPRLLSMTSNFDMADEDHMEARAARYERLVALGQLAPSIDDEHVGSVLEASLNLAGSEGRYCPDLLLPLASFERVFREGGVNEPGSIINRCRALCLESIRAVLETVVGALAEADHDSISKAVGMLPLVHTAGVSLLTILPSVLQAEGDACGEKMVDILDSCEWLLSRKEGFPGARVGPEEIAMYDSVRSMLSVCAAITGLYSDEFSSSIETMRIAQREGPHVIGTVVLDFIRGGHGVEAMELMRSLVRHELEWEAGPGNKPLDRGSFTEIAALAWHLDIGDPSLVKAVLQRTRDPRGQFYLHKTLEGAPW